jgi:predicted Zn-dependent protease
MQLGQALRTPAALRRSASPSLAGSQELADAQRAEAENQLPEAARRYQALVQQVPFNEAAVLAAARFLTGQKAYTDAYDALNKGLTENPTSLPLLQAYALAAADAGLADLGQSALAQLQPRLSAAEYANLLAQFAAHRAAHAAAGAAFDQPLLPAR